MPQGPVFVTPHYGDSIPIHADSGLVAASAAIATLPAVNDRLLFLTGFEITAAGATAGSAVEVTVVGVLGGTLSYVYTFPTGAVVPAPPLICNFNPPIPASGKNVAIVVTLPAAGAGNTAAAAVAHGYYLP
jgi:hypothetical protein